MGIEFELKYKASPDTLAAVAATLEGAVQQFEMRTAYYDTVHRKLSARHWTLRRRMENDKSVCTLKTPAAGGARREFEVECSDILEAVPVLCKLSKEPELAAFAAEGLTEICGARFHRTAITVQLVNAVAEVALDHGVLLGGEKELPLCEIEVELKKGDRATVAAYASLLAAHFHLESESLSKFRRAVLLAEGD